MRFTKETNMVAGIPTGGFGVIFRINVCKMFSLLFPDLS